MSKIFRDTEFYWGQAGLPGTGITEGEKGTINSRLDALETAGTDLALNDLTDVSAGSPSIGDIIRWNNSAWEVYTPVAATVTFGLPIIIDGGGDTVSTGVKADIPIPFACTITGWTLLGDVSGSAVIQVQRATSISTWPTVAEISGASTRPTLSSSQKASSTTLTGWTTSIAAGNIIRINVSSASTVGRLVLMLTMTRQVQIWQIS